MKVKTLITLLILVSLIDCKSINNNVETVRNKTNESGSIINYPHASSIIFPFSGCYIGAMIKWKVNEEGTPWEKIKIDIDEFQNILGKSCPIISVNMAFKYSDRLNKFPINFYDAINNNNSIMLVSWEPRDWDQSYPEFSARSILPDILAGKYDLYIDGWSNDIKKLKIPVLIRFAHEMNGNWFPWSGVFNGAGNKKKYPDSSMSDGAQTYINAYRHIVDRFRQDKVENVYWVWNPNRENIPDEEWNHYSKYYPGDDYVDIIGVDSYNWGSTHAWSKWQTFDELFKDAYKDFTALYPNKIFIIGEFSSAGSGGNKAGWITDAFTKIKENYPKIKAFIWLQANNLNEKINNLDENSDWRVDSDPDSKNAFINMMKDKYYLDKIIFDK